MDTEIMRNIRNALARINYCLWALGGSQAGVVFTAFGARVGSGEGLSGTRGDTEGHGKHE